MKYNEKVMGLLTICTKAGKAVYGFDAVKESILEGKAKLILLSCDVSPKTAKEVRFNAQKTGIAVLGTDISIQEMGFKVGKRAAVTAVCDEGFAARFKAIIGEQAAQSDK